MYINLKYIFTGRNIYDNIGMYDKVKCNEKLFYM